jgi:ABC-2 type transport system ATP-binding protein
VIRTARLCKDYNGFSAVKDVTLQVEPNEIYGFLGPNGAGKTTTIMMLLGIEKPTSGQVFLFGQSLPENYFEIKRRIGVLAEHQYFYDDMTAREYLSFFADKLAGGCRPAPIWRC